jgi:hypothetical protein
MLNEAIRRISAVPAALVCLLFALALVVTSAPAWRFFLLGFNPGYIRHPEPSHALDVLRRDHVVVRGPRHPDVGQPRIDGHLARRSSHRAAH